MIRIRQGLGAVDEQGRQAKQDESGRAHPKHFTPIGEMEGTGKNQWDHLRHGGRSEIAPHVAPGERRSNVRPANILGKRPYCRNDTIGRERHYATCHGYCQRTAEDGAEKIGSGSDSAAKEERKSPSPTPSKSACQKIAPPASEQHSTRLQASAIDTYRLAVI